MRAPRLAAQRRRLTTIQDAADYLACDPRTVSRMIARGDLTGYRYNRMIRVDLNEVDAALRVVPTTGGRDG
jgi:excisionase family DNA binding protein